MVNSNRTPSSKKQPDNEKKSLAIRKVKNTDTSHNLFKVEKNIKDAINKLTVPNYKTSTPKVPCLSNKLLNISNRNKMKDWTGNSERKMVSSRNVSANLSNSKRDLATMKSFAVKNSGKVQSFINDSIGEQRNTRTLLKNNARKHKALQQHFDSVIKNGLDDSMKLRAAKQSGSKTARTGKASSRGSSLGVHNDRCKNVEDNVLASKTSYKEALKMYGSTRFKKGAEGKSLADWKAGKVTSLKNVKAKVIKHLANKLHCKYLFEALLVYAAVYIGLSLIHICRCRRYAVCRSRWSPYH
eukprot:TRINITY_DN14234_c0_g1_i2.p1 TRINITY_DN14234_c0_g1~~TRINITY_DN14234_c0_g1_i2.p1  ORF type:complete len:298 (+),score=76.59 TRINITY_DN14234_c0_g1_i2:171-1064(+)